MKGIDEALESKNHGTLNIRVVRGVDFQLLGRIVANCIRRMKELPEVKVEDALIKVISQEAHGDSEMIARLGIRYGDYVSALFRGNGAGCFDLQVVYVDDGQEGGPSYKEALELQQQLGAILGDERVRICSVTEGEGSRYLDDSLVRNAREVRAAVSRL